MSIAANSNLALLVAMVLATGYFAQIIYQDLQALPSINALRLIAVGTGLFYFGGASARVFAADLWPSSPYLLIGAAWKDYTPTAMSAASALVLMCCGLTIFISYFYKPRYLSKIYTIDDFHGAVGQSQKFEYTKALIFVVILAAVSGYLLVTGELSVGVARSQSYENVSVLTQSSEFMTWLVVASVGLFVTLLFDRRASLVSWSLTLGLGVIFWATLFVLGRRQFMAGLLIALLTWLVYTRKRLNSMQWAAALGAALVAFFAISSLFLQLRSAQSAAHTIAVTEAFSERTRAQAARMGPTDLAALSATRTDILGELALFVVRFPPEHVHLGAGMVSHAMSLIPAQFFPNKDQFLAEGFYGDDKVCIDAGVAPNDLASTLVLYSFAEFWWFAPLMYAFAAMGFVWVLDKAVQITKSYCVYAMAVASFVSYAIMADTSYPVAIFGTIRSVIMVACLFMLSRLVFPVGTARVRSSARPRLNQA